MKLIEVNKTPAGSELGPLHRHAAEEMRARLVEAIHYESSPECDKPTLMELLK